MNGRLFSVAYDKKLMYKIKRFLHKSTEYMPEKFLSTSQLSIVKVGANVYPTSVS